MRVVQGSGALIVSDPFVDGIEEEPAAADDVAVAVTDAAGTVLDPPDVTDGDDDGYYIATLTPDHTADLGPLTLVWSGTVAGVAQVQRTSVEVVGGHYLSVPDLRTIAGASKYSTAELRGARDEFEDLCERYRGVAFVPRASVVSVDYRDFGHCPQVYLPYMQIRRVRSVTQANELVDTVDWTFDGIASVTVPYTTGLTAVVVEHGFDSPPEAAKRACRDFVDAALSSRFSALNDNVISWSNDSGGTYRASTADYAAGRPTGYRKVDDVLNELPDYRLPGIA